jgi:hypothetical protein
MMIRHIQNGMAVIVFLVTAMMMASAAHADGLWQVDSQSGDVRVAVEGVTLVSLGDARTLPAGTRISTGSTGRMVLRRGDEAIVVAPNTSIELAPASRQGLATTIIQSIGTILLSVDKKEQQHFEVETPYLAAVVKGTKFAVTVADGKSSVHVVQGAVEVLDFASGDVGMVRPGQTADVISGSGLGLTVTGPGAIAPTKAQRTGRTPRVAAPEAADANQDAAAAPAAVPAPVRINAPMGVTAPDMTAATGGLVRQASLEPTGFPAASASDAGNGNGNGLALGATAGLGSQATSGGSNGLALGSSGNSAGGNSGGNGGGLALGASTGSSGGLALGASNGNSGGGLALGASVGGAGGNSGGNGGGLALGLSLGDSGNNAGGSGNGLALGLSIGGGNAGGGGNGNGNGLALGLNLGNGNGNGNGGGLALGLSLGGGNDNDDDDDDGDDD